jgi:predicted nucleotidyltransferase
MGGSASAILREDANHVVEALVSKVEGLRGACLFGSVARGTASPRSDLDLIFVGVDSSLTRAELRDLLPPELGDLRLSLAYHTPETLDEYLRRWSRFAAHLRMEGEVLFDRRGELQTLISRELPVVTGEELRVQCSHLRNYRYPERFGNQFLFPLETLYRVGRCVAFVLLAERGELVYNAVEAFSRLALQHPERSEDIHAVRRVKPFYDLVTRRGEITSLPFEPVDCRVEVELARDAVGRLVGLSRDRDVVTN